MIRPTVAVVAAEEPEIAANIVQPSTLTWRSLPGSRVVHGASPVKREAERREWNRISAIRMKSGSAMSSGVVVTFQVSCARSFSIGMLRKMPRPTRPGAKSASPTHTPSPSPRASTPMTTPAARTVTASSHPELPPRLLVLRRVAREEADRPRHELEGEEHRPEGHRALGIDEGGLVDGGRGAARRP